MIQKAILRPDARPTDWATLTKSQQGAIKGLVEILDAAVTSAHASSPAAAVVSSRVPWLDRDRETRLAFLDGPRGVGKSTVLTTLVKAVDDGQLAGAGEEGITDETLSRLKSSIVWLEPIDAEPEPEEVNLLGAIVARIERALEDYSDLTFAHEGDGGNELEVSSPQEKALADFRRVQNKLALAYDTGARPRGDLDQVAIETRRRELAKLGLHQELNGALERVGRTVLRSTVNNPVFVLPVDDLDLNPLLCVRLLELLRAVTVPRLFTLAIGSIDVVDFVLRAHQAGRFRGVASGAAGQRLRAEIERRADEVARNNLRKLLPVGQRVRLEGIQIREALDFHPFGVAPSESLRKLLQSVRIRVSDALAPFARLVVGSRTPSLFELFQVSRERPLRRGTPDDIRFIEYSGLQILATRPRRLVDIWQLLRDASTHQPAASDDESDFTNGLVWDGFARVVAQRLSAYVEQVVNEERAVAGGGTEDDSYDVNAGGELRVEPCFDEQVRITTHSEARIVVSASTGWSFFAPPPAPVKGAPDATLQPLRLSPEAISALVMKHDVDALLRDDVLSIRYFDQRSRSGWWAQTEWPNVSPGQAPYSAAWPLPCCTTFVQWDWFLARWRIAVERAQRERTRSGTARDWLAYGTSVLDGVAVPQSDDWQSLYGNGGRLAQLIEKPDRSGLAPSAIASLWAEAAVSMLLPEYGLEIPLSAVGREVRAFIQLKQETLYDAHYERIVALRKTNNKSSFRLFRQLETKSYRELFPRFVERWAENNSKRSTTLGASQRVLQVDALPELEPDPPPKRMTKSKRRAKAKK